MRVRGHRDWRPNTRLQCRNERPDQGGRPYRDTHSFPQCRRWISLACSESDRNRLTRRIMGVAGLPLIGNYQTNERSSERKSLVKSRHGHATRSERNSGKRLQDLRSFSLRSPRVGSCGHGWIWFGETVVREAASKRKPGAGDRRPTASGRSDFRQADVLVLAFRRPSVRVRERRRGQGLRGFLVQSPGVRIGRMGTGRRARQSGLNTMPFRRATVLV